MIYHICCNQVEHCWEIRDKFENVIFKGRLKEVQEEYRKYKIIEELDKLENFFNDNTSKYD